MYKIMLSTPSSSLHLAISPSGHHLRAHTLAAYPFASHHLLVEVDFAVVFVVVVFFAVVVLIGVVGGPGFVFVVETQTEVVAIEVTTNV